ncbi:predicted protein, partial [Nematostella vectensis]
TGYGHLTPRTDGGRLFLLFFAVVGIPLCVTTLKVLGEQINVGVAFCIKHLERKLFHREAKNINIKQMVVAVLLLLSQLLIGGVMYNVTEDWNYVSSVYYCFIVFSTIGFGDLV